MNKIFLSILILLCCSNYDLIYAQVDTLKEKLIEINSVFDSYQAGYIEYSFTTYDLPLQINKDTDLEKALDIQLNSYFNSVKHDIPKADHEIKEDFKKSINHILDFWSIPKINQDDITLKWSPGYKQKTMKTYKLKMGEAEYYDSPKLFNEIYYLKTPSFSVRSEETAHSYDNFGNVNSKMKQIVISDSNARLPRVIENLLILNLSYIIDNWDHYNIQVDENQQKSILAPIKTDQVYSKVICETKNDRIEKIEFYKNEQLEKTYFFNSFNEKGIPIKFTIFYNQKIDSERFVVDTPYFVDVVINDFSLSNTSLEKDAFTTYIHGNATVNDYRRDKSLSVEEILNSELLIEK